MSRATATAVQGGGEPESERASEVSRAPATASTDTSVMIDPGRFDTLARVAAIAVVGTATTVIIVGWMLDVRAGTGRLADDWPATTPWAAVMFALLGVAVLVPARWSRSGITRMILLSVTVALAIALLIQTMLGTRELIEDLILPGALARVGGGFPGMPSVQTLATVISLGSAALLLERGVQARARTVLLTAGLLMGLAGGLATALTAATMSFGDRAYGYSVLTAGMSVLGAFALTSLDPSVAPALILRARPLPSAAVLSVGAVIGTPAITAIASVQTDHGTAVDALQGVAVFTFLALAVAWLAWFAMNLEIWRTVARSGTDGVVLMDRDGHVESADRGAVELTGWGADQMLGRSVGDLVENDTADITQLVRDVADSMTPAHLDHHPLSFEGSGGRRVEVSVRLLPTITADGLRVVATLKDVARELEFRRRSMHDPLTGVLNRRGILDALEDALGESPGSTAVMFIDVDHFKEINDLDSHAAGDRALCHVAESLQRCVRSGDIVGRFGGDEFVCVMRGITEDSVLREVADRLAWEVSRHQVNQPAGRTGITVSIGAAVANPRCTTDTLLSRVDAALLEAKRTGRDRIVVADRVPVGFSGPDRSAEDPRPDPPASKDSVHASDP